MKLLPTYLCFLILLFVYPTNNLIIAQEELNNESFWLFTTGNETIDEYRIIKLADGNNYNASISKVTKTANNIVTVFNITTDYYYTDDGFILGSNMIGDEYIAPNDQFPNGISFKIIESSQRFSSLNRSNHVGIKRQTDILYTSEFNLTRNVSKIYYYDYFPVIKYKLFNGEIVDAIPFNITSNMKDNVGIVTLEYFDRIKIINQSNGNFNVTEIYNNGTIINVIISRNTVEVYWGYYVPKLFKAIDISVTAYGLGGNSLSLNSLGNNINNDIKVNSDPLDNKILLDYFIDPDFYDIPTETTTSQESTTTSITTTTISEVTSLTSVTSTSSINEETITSNNVIDTNYTGPLESDGDSKLPLEFAIIISTLVLLVFYRGYKKRRY